jgi:hypothetical protein
MINEAMSNEKVSAGWIRIDAYFEVLAITKEAAESALEAMFKKIEEENNILVYSKDVQEAKKVEKPMKGIDAAWSMIMEIKCVVKNFETAVQFVIKYGPSSIEILEPKNINLKIDSAQVILNSVSAMMHQFAAAGVGGIVFVKPQ